MDRRPGWSSTDVEMHSTRAAQAARASSSHPRGIRLNSLNTRLVLLFLVLALAPMAVVGGLAYWQSSSALRARISQQLDTIAVDDVSAINTWLTQRNGEMRDIAANSTVRTMDSMRAPILLQGDYDQWSLYHSISLWKADGSAIYTAGSTPSSNVVKENWFQAAMHAKAAKSTAELIADSGRRTQEGVRVMGETDHALAEIVQNMRRAKDLVSDIATASEEESRALAQISTAMNQVNSGAQSSSAQSEQLASTAEELSGLAEALRKGIDRFRLQRVIDGKKPDTELLHSLANGMPSQLTPEMVQALRAWLGPKQGTLVRETYLSARGK